MSENAKKSSARPRSRDPRLVSDNRSKQPSELSSAKSTPEHCKRQSPQQHSHGAAVTCASAASFPLTGGLCSNSTTTTSVPPEQAIEQLRQTPHTISDPNPLTALQSLLPGLSKHSVPKENETPLISAMPQIATPESYTMQKHPSDVKLALHQSSPKIPNPLSTLHGLLPGLSKVKPTQSLEDPSDVKLPLHHSSPKIPNPLSTLHGLLPGLSKVKPTQTLDDPLHTLQNLLPGLANEKTANVQHCSSPTLGSPARHSVCKSSSETTVSQVTDDQLRNILKSAVCENQTGTSEPAEDVVTTKNDSQDSTGGMDMNAKEDSRAHTLTFKARKQKRNVLTRMEDYSVGPMSVLRQAVEENRRVRVWTRSYKHVRGICTGYVLIFDKHWNIVLADVDELYMDPRRKLREYTSIQHLISCQVDRENHDELLVKDHSKEPRKRRRRRAKNPCEELNVVTNPRAIEDTDMHAEPLQEDLQNFGPDSLDVSEDKRGARNKNPACDDGLSPEVDAAMELTVSAASVENSAFSKHSRHSSSSESLSSIASDSCDIPQPACDKTSTQDVPKLKDGVVTSESSAAAAISPTLASTSSSLSLSSAAPVARRRFSKTLLNVREQLWDDDDDESDHELVIDTHEVVAKESLAKPGEDTAKFATIRLDVLGVNSGQISTDANQNKVKIFQSGGVDDTISIKHGASVNACTIAAAEHTSSESAIVSEKPGLSSSHMTDVSGHNEPSIADSNISDEPDSATPNDSSKSSSFDSDGSLTQMCESQLFSTSSPSLAVTQENILRGILKKPQGHLSSFRIPKKKKEVASPSSKVIFGILKKPANIGSVKTPSEISQSLSGPQDAAKEPDISSSNVMERVNPDSHANRSSSTSLRSERAENIRSRDSTLSRDFHSHKHEEPSKCSSSHKGKGSSSKSSESDPESKQVKHRSRHGSEGRDSDRHKSANDKSKSGKIWQGEGKRDESEKKSPPDVPNGPPMDSKVGKEQKDLHGHVDEKKSSSDPESLKGKHKKRTRKDKSGSQESGSDRASRSSARGVESVGNGNKHEAGSGKTSSEEKSDKHKLEQKSPKRICPKSPRKMCTKSPKKSKHKSPRREKHSDKESAKDKSKLNLSLTMDSSSSKSHKNKAAVVDYTKSQHTSAMDVDTSKDEEPSSSKTRKRDRKKAGLETADDGSKQQESMSRTQLERNAQPVPAVDTTGKPAKRVKTSDPGADGVPDKSNKPHQERSRHEGVERLRSHSNEAQEQPVEDTPNCQLDATPSKSDKPTGTKRMTRSRSQSTSQDGKKTNPPVDAVSQVKNALSVPSGNSAASDSRTKRRNSSDHDTRSKSHSADRHSRVDGNPAEKPTQVSTQKTKVRKSPSSKSKHGDSAPEIVVATEKFKGAGPSEVCVDSAVSELDGLVSEEADVKYKQKKIDDSASKIETGHGSVRDRGSTTVPASQSGDVKTRDTSVLVTNNEDQDAAISSKPKPDDGREGKSVSHVEKTAQDQSAPLGHNPVTAQAKVAVNTECLMKQASQQQPCPSSKPNIPHRTSLGKEVSLMSNEEPITQQCSAGAPGKSSEMSTKQVESPQGVSSTKKASEKSGPLVKFSIRGRLVPVPKSPAQSGSGVRFSLKGRLFRDGPSHLPTLNEEIVKRFPLMDEPQPSMVSPAQKSLQSEAVIPLEDGVPPTSDIDNVWASLMESETSVQDSTGSSCTRQSEGATFIAGDKQQAQGKQKESMPELPNKDILLEPSISDDKFVNREVKKEAVQPENVGIEGNEGNPSIVTSHCDPVDICLKREHKEATTESHSKRKSRSKKPLQKQENSMEKNTGAQRTRCKASGKRGKEQTEKSKTGKKSKKGKRKSKSKENEKVEEDVPDVCDPSETDQLNIYGEVSDGEPMETADIDGIDEVELFRRGSDDEKPSTSALPSAIDVEDCCINDFPSEEEEVVSVHSISSPSDLSEVDQVDGPADKRSTAGKKSKKEKSTASNKSSKTPISTPQEDKEKDPASPIGVTNLEEGAATNEVTSSKESSQSEDDPLSKAALFGSDHSSEDSGDDADVEDEADAESDGVGSEDSISYATDGSESVSGASQSDEEDDDESASVNEASVEDNASDTADDGKIASPRQDPPVEVDVDGADAKLDVSVSPRLTKLVIGSRPGVISESDTDHSPKPDHPTVGYKSPKHMSSDVMVSDGSDSEHDEAFQRGEKSAGPSMSTEIEESQGFSVLGKSVECTEQTAEAPEEAKECSNPADPEVSDSTEGSTSGSGSESESEVECNITDCDCQDAEGSSSGLGSGSASDTSESSSGESSGEVTCITISDSDSEPATDKPRDSHQAAIDVVQVKQEKVSPGGKSATINTTEQNSVAVKRNLNMESPNAASSITAKSSGSGRADAEMVEGRSGAKVESISCDSDVPSLKNIAASVVERGTQNKGEKEMDVVEQGVDTSMTTTRADDVDPASSDSKSVPEKHHEGTAEEGKNDTLESSKRGVDTSRDGYISPASSDRKSLSEKQQMDHDGTVEERKSVTSEVPEEQQMNHDGKVEEGKSGTFGSLKRDGDDPADSDRKSVPEEQEINHDGMAEGDRECVTHTLDEGRQENVNKLTHSVDYSSHKENDGRTSSASLKDDKNDVTGITQAMNKKTGKHSLPSDQICSRGDEEKEADENDKIDDAAQLVSEARDGAAGDVGNSTREVNTNSVTAEKVETEKVQLSDGEVTEDASEQKEGKNSSLVGRESATDGDVCSSPVKIVSPTSSGKSLIGTPEHDTSDLTSPSNDKLAQKNVIGKAPIESSCQNRSETAAIDSEVVLSELDSVSTHPGVQGTGNDGIGGKKSGLVMSGTPTEAEKDPEKEMMDTQDQAPELLAESVAETSDKVSNNVEMETISGEHKSPPDLHPDSKDTGVVDGLSQDHQSGDDIGEEMHVSHCHEDDILDVHGAEDECGMFEDSDEGLLSDEKADAAEEFPAHKGDSESSSSDESTDGEIEDDEEDLEIMVAKLSKMKEELASLTFRAKSRERDRRKSHDIDSDRRSHRDKDSRSSKYDSRYDEPTSHCRTDRKDDRHYRSDRYKEEDARRKSDKYDRVSSRTKAEFADSSTEQSSRYHSKREEYKSRREQRAPSPSDRMRERDERRQKEDQEYQERSGRNRSEKEVSRHTRLSEKDARDRSGRNEDLAEKDSRERKYREIDEKFKQKLGQHTESSEKESRDKSRRPKELSEKEFKDKTSRHREICDKDSSESSGRHRELAARERYERRKDAEHRDYRDKESRHHPSHDERIRTRDEEHTGRSTLDRVSSRESGSSRNEAGRRTRSNQLASPPEKSHKKDVSREREGSVCRMELYSCMQKKATKKSASSSREQSSEQETGKSSIDSKVLGEESQKSRLEQEGRTKVCKTGKVEDGEKCMKDQPQKRKRKREALRDEDPCSHENEMQLANSDQIKSGKDDARSLNDDCELDKQPPSEHNAEGNCQSLPGLAQQGIMPVKKECYVIQESERGLLHQVIDSVSDSALDSNEVELLYEELKEKELVAVENDKMAAGDGRELLEDVMDSTSELSEGDLDDLYKFSATSSASDSENASSFADDLISDEEAKNRSISDEIFILRERETDSVVQMDVDSRNRTPEPPADESEGAQSSAVKPEEHRSQGADIKDSPGVTGEQVQSIIQKKQDNMDGEASKAGDEVPKQRVESPSRMRHPREDHPEGKTTSRSGHHSARETRYRRERRDDYLHRRDYEKRRYDAHEEKRKEYEQRAQKHKDDGRSRKAMDYYSYMQKVMEKEKKKIEAKLDRYKVEYERWRRRSGEHKEYHSSSRKDTRYDDVTRTKDDKSHRSSSERRYKDDGSSPRDWHRLHPDSSRDYDRRRPRHDSHSHSRSISPLTPDLSTRKSSKEKHSHSRSPLRTPTPTDIDKRRLKKQLQKDSPRPPGTPTPTETLKEGRELTDSVHAQASSKTRRCLTSSAVSKTTTSVVPTPEVERNELDKGKQSATPTILTPDDPQMPVKDGGREKPADKRGVEGSEGKHAGNVEEVRSVPMETQQTPMIETSSAPIPPSISLQPADSQSRSRPQHSSHEACETALQSPTKSKHSDRKSFHSDVSQTSNMQARSSCKFKRKDLSSSPAELAGMATTVSEINKSSHAGADLRQTLRQKRPNMDPSKSRHDFSPERAKKRTMAKTDVRIGADEAFDVYNMAALIKIQESRTYLREGVYSRHVKQMMIRGDNVVMVAFAD